ncbi:MAG: septum site-determining protein MinD [Nanoarchaeota archaeon]|nr:septum site-determining protein MinD [Nanoarchaeota archaeon]
MINVSTNTFGARIIGIVSGKGGVGKTTTTTNLGTGLAYNYHEDVIMIDANTTSAGLSVHLGKYSYNISLNDVLKGKAHVSQAMYSHPSGARFIPATTNISSIDVDPKGVKKIVNELKEHVDYILLDCAPTLGDESGSGIDASNEIIVVSNSEWPALLEAKRTIEYCKKKKKKLLGLILTKTNPDNIDLLNDISKNLGIPILGVVRADEKIIESIKKRVPIIHSFPYSKASEDYEKILEKITEEKYYGKKNIIRKVLAKITN